MNLASAPEGGFLGVCRHLLMTNASWDVKRMCAKRGESGGCCGDAQMPPLKRRHMVSDCAAPSSPQVTAAISIFHASSSSSRAPAVTPSRNAPSHPSLNHSPSTRTDPAHRGDSGGTQQQARTLHDNYKPLTSVVSTSPSHHTYNVNTSAQSTFLHICCVHHQRLQDIIAKVPLVIFKMSWLD